jgi:hypothetical protein
MATSIIPAALLAASTTSSGNNGILSTGGMAASPTAASPVANSQAPVTNSLTNNNAASNYAGLSNASTQLSNPSLNTVTPAQTVQGQMSGILASGSPLMQQADTTGLQTANSRGLLNSSMAAGSAENSMIAAATPIAQQDATTNYNSAIANQNTQNAFATTNAANAYNEQQNVYNQNVATANAQSAQQNSQQNNLQSQIGSMNTQLNNDIATILTSQTMNQQAKDYSIQQLDATYKAQVSMLSAVGTVPDVSTLLSASSVPGIANAKAPAPGYVAAPAPTTQTAPASSGGSVICTYYHDIGWMDDETYKADSVYGDSVWAKNPEFMAWYWSWAYNFVGWLGGGEFRHWFFWPLVFFWSKQMKHEILHTSPSNTGKAIMFIGEFAFKVMRKFKTYGMAQCKR